MLRNLLHFLRDLARHDHHWSEAHLTAAHVQTPAQYADAIRRTR